MSNHRPGFHVAHPRGEHEVNHLGVSVSYPTLAQAQAAANQGAGKRKTGDK